MPEQKHHVHFGLLRGPGGCVGSKTDDAVNTSHRQLPRTPDEMKMLQFPVTKNSLWDHTSTGQPVHLNISYFRKPKLLVLEKVLRFAQRHAESTGQSVYNCALLGSLDIDEDGEGVTFVLDRFDPGGVTTSGGLTPGDIIVPFMISGHSKNERFSSMEDYVNALMVLKEKCCGKEPVHCSNFLLTKGWCNFYTNGDKCVHHLEFDIVTMATEFIATPVSPVPIVPTALSKNLSGPMSLSHLQGEPKSGYLTMDHTRKVLLVLESDPKAYSLPLVGIWLSGVPFVYSPYTWAACLRFLFNTSIHDRVCVPPESFLLVLYNPMHSKPEFYEVSTTLGSSKMTFDLMSGYEAVSLPKMMTSSPDDSVSVDILSLDKGNKKEMFDAAIHSFQSQLNSPTQNNSSSSCEHEPPSEDITPRCKPAPHRSKLPAAMPMVPEVSLLFAEDGQSGILTDTGPRRPLINQGRPHGVNKLMDFGHSGQVPNGVLASIAYSQQSVPFSSQSQAPRMTHHSQSAPNLLHTTSSTSQTIQCFNSTEQQKLPIQGEYGANRNLVHSNSLPQQYLENGYPPNSVNNGRPLMNSQQGNVMYQNDIKYQGAVKNPLQGSVQYGQCNPIPAQNRMRLSNGGQHPQMAGSLSNPHGPIRPVINPNNNMLLQQQPPQPRYNYHGYSDQYNMMNGTRMSQPIRHSVPFNNPVSQQGTYPPQQGTYPPQQVTYPPQQGIHHPQSYPNQNVFQNGGNIHMAQIPAFQTPQQASKTLMVPEMFQQKVSPNIVTPSSVGTGRQSPPPVTLAGNNNVTSRPTGQRPRSSNHSDSSGRSSDDSGLSVTPEKPSLQQKGNEDTKQASNIQNSNINWSQVPPEVYQLLLSQDAQLKQLQAQIQLLMHNQSTSTQCTTTTELSSQTETIDPQSNNASVDSALTNSKVETCSVAVNTTMFYPSSQNNREHHTVALQTSPQKPRTSPRQPVSSRSGNNTPSEGSQCSVDGRTPADIRHRGVFTLNSTERDDFDVDVSNSDLSGVVNNMALHEKTIDSVQSELIVDLPSYHSSPTRSRTSQDTGSGSAGLSTSSRSPISASMCEQQQYDSCSDTDSEEEEDDEEEEKEQGGQLSSDSKEYYDKLMNNIHQLLNQQSHEETGQTEGDAYNMTATLPNDTLQQSIMLGQYLNSLHRLENHRNPMETTFIPKINYMSMMLDSDSDTSMEINAMAMKYLKDEQLTKLTKLQNQAMVVKGTKETHRLAALRHILAEEREETTPNVTTLGMSPNDLTFATRKYMEKHGLLNDSKNSRQNSADAVISNDSYELRMNYSSNSSKTNTPTRISREMVKTPTSDRLKTPIQFTPENNRDSKKSKCPSGNVSKEKSPYVNSYSNENNSRLPKMDLQFTPTPKNTPNRDTHQGQGINYSTEKFSQDVKHNKFNTPTRNNLNGDVLTTPKQGHHNGIDHIHNKGNISSPLQNTPKINTRKVERVISPIAPDSPIQRHIESGHVEPKADNAPSPSSANESWDDADKILDITRLKQLPKLL